ncbi:MAG: ATP-binding protein [Lentisphaerales bacterium]|jgi:predicted AAA+ superfamily ATPase|nr:MAG: ATP-binding protein [Lentisphaerales bacterium]
MSTLGIIQDVLLEAQHQDFFTGVPRHLPYRLVGGKAFVCIGVRRCGKSTLLHQIIARLKQAGTRAEDILYVNFFDDRLDDVRKGKLGLLTEAYYGLYPEKKGKRGVHCFLDEVQMATGWESFADRLQRSEKMGVYASGSSARLLARELGTAMRGRSLAWELFPFSFAEFLDARGIARDIRGQQGRSRIRKGFDEYWEKGGFPEVLDTDPRLRVMIHQEYFKTMIFRDVVERNDALHPRAVRDMAYRLLNAAASMYTVNALTGYLKSLGHKVSKAFVGDVIEWLEDAYSLFTVRLFDASVSRQHANPKKIYAVDHALVRSTTNGVLVNSGHLLENLVFVDGRRRGRELHYYRTASGREVDFAWRGEDGALRLVQVAERAPEESDTRARELTALREAMRECPKSRSFLVTRDEEEGQVQVPEGSIHVMPVWRYLIADE